MSLIGLKNEASVYRSKINEEKSRLEEYKEKASKLDDLYEKLKVKKNQMKELKKSLKSFSKKDYDYFEGNVFDYRYKSNIKELVEHDYKTMIDIIDDNLDEINNKRTYYENQIHESKGIIGNFISTLNSIQRRIENWFN